MHDARSISSEDRPPAMTAEAFRLELARALARAEARRHHAAEQQKQAPAENS